MKLNARGSSIIVVVLGISVLFSVGVVAHLKNSFSNEKKIRNELHQITGFYGADIVAIHMAQKERAGINWPTQSSPQPIPVSFNNDALAMLNKNISTSVSQRTLEYTANIHKTSRYVTSNSYLSEATDNRLFAMPSTSIANVFCAGFNLSGATKDFKLCLSQNSGTCTGSQLTGSVFSNGSGTVSDPYIICSLSQLSEVRNKPMANYKIGKDIEASSTNTIPWVPIPAFSGVLDGNSKTISNFSLSLPNNDAGLFLSIDGAQIKNFSIKNMNVSGARSGGFAVTLNNTLLENISLDGSSTGNKGGSVLGSDTGLLAASATNVTVTKCTLTGSASMTGNLLLPLDRRAFHYVGLMFGRMSGGSISKCAVNTRVTAEGNGGLGVGGLLGFADLVKISQVTVEGSMNVTGHTYMWVGMMIGNAHAVDISRSWTKGTLEDFSHEQTEVGGLVGRMYLDTQRPVILTTQWMPGDKTSTISDSFSHVDISVTASFNLSGNLLVTVHPMYVSAGGLMGSAESRHGRYDHPAGIFPIKIERSYASGPISVIYLPHPYETHSLCDVGPLIGTTRAALAKDSFGAGTAKLAGRIYAPRTFGIFGSGQAAENSFYYYSYPLQKPTCHMYLNVNKETCPTTKLTDFYNKTNAPTSAMFSSWDFSSVWYFPSNGFPLLR